LRTLLDSGSKGYVYDYFYNGREGINFVLMEAFLIKSKDVRGKLNISRLKHKEAYINHLDKIISKIFKQHPELRELYSNN